MAITGITNDGFPVFDDKIAQKRDLVTGELVEVRISKATCYKLIAEGVIPHKQVGRLIRISRAELLARLGAVARAENFPSD